MMQLPSPIAWAWSMTPGRTQETPLVHDGIMFIQNADHTIQALNAATGDLIWEYEYDLPDDAPVRGVRNKAIYGDTLIIATRDAHLREGLSDRREGRIP